MYKITREAIRRLATTETVYYRGMRYYAAHAVSDVTWNEATTVSYTHLTLPTN